MVCYNAFLPEISTPDERDKVSSYGWALGYLGGGLLLALNLVFFSMREPRWNIDAGTAVRISLASAGLWWAGFTIIPLLALHNRQPQRSLPSGERYLTVGFKQLGHTLRNLPQLSANAALPGRLPALQRRHPDGDRPLGPVWQRGTGHGRRRIAGALSHGAVCGLLWRAGLWLSGPLDWRQAGDHHQPGHLDRRRPSTPIRRCWKRGASSSCSRR